MAKKIANGTAEVDQFMSQLDHPLKDGIEQVRSSVLGSNQQITEHIKWNAPSFCYEGEDRVTFRLAPGGEVQLIFHRGAKVRDSTDFVFEDRTDLLKWVTADRAIVTLGDMEDVKANIPALVDVINQWVKAAT